jgi:hypothetical protein
MNSTTRIRKKEIVGQTRDNGMRNHALVDNANHCHQEIMATIIPPRLQFGADKRDSLTRLTIMLDRLMIVSNQAFSAGFCMYH